MQRGHRFIHLLDAALGLAMAAMHGVDHVAGALLQAFDHPADLFHRVLGAPGEVAHFVGDHREAAAGVAGAGRLDGRVERQQVGLLGDGADHFQHRTDFLAAAGQLLDLAHGAGQVGGQAVDALCGAVDQRQAVAGRLVGTARGVGGLGGATGDVLGSGGHLVGCGGDLVDLAELLLHAGAGLAGNRRRLVGGTARIAHRDLHVADDRLQLVEKTVEPTGQFAQLVAPGVRQTLGQVAFAAGDVAQHVGDAEDRPGHAAGAQPQHQQAEHRGAEAEAQFDPGAFATHVVQLPLQRQGRAEQGALRHFKEHAPGLGAGNRLQRLQHLEVVVLVEQPALAGGQQLQEFAGVLRIRLGQVLAEQAGVAAVAGEQPGRAEDADLADAVVEFAVALFAERLQVAQVDVQAHHADHLAIQFEGKGDAGHQQLAFADLVEVRIEHAGLPAFLRAGVPGVVGRAAGPAAGVGEFGLDHRLGFQLSRRGLRPVQGEASLVVAAQGGLVDEQFVLAVQRIGFEDHVQAEHLGIGGERGAHLAGQVFAQVVGIEEALLRLVAEEQDLPGEALAVLEGIHEIALDA